MLDDIIKNIKTVAKHYGISHSTIEAETDENDCNDTDVISKDRVNE